MTDRGGNQLAVEDGRTLTKHLFGGFRITAGDQGVTNLEHARLQDLLAYLLLQRGRPVSRQHLAFLFWPDSGEKQARTNLRTLWHRLRRALPDAERFIDANEAALQWLSDAPYWLDVAEFEEALAQARTAADPLPHLEQAVALYGGELLPGSYHEWLLAERERLSQLYSRALQELAAARGAPPVPPRHRSRPHPAAPRPPARAGLRPVDAPARAGR